MSSHDGREVYLLQVEPGLGSQRPARRGRKRRRSARRSARSASSLSSSRRSLGASVGSAGIGFADLPALVSAADGDDSAQLSSLQAVSSLAAELEARLAEALATREGLAAATDMLQLETRGSRERCAGLERGIKTTQGSLRELAQRLAAVEEANVKLSATKRALEKQLSDAADAGAGHDLLTRSLHTASHVDMTVVTQCLRPVADGAQEKLRSTRAEVASLRTLALASDRRLKSLSSELEQLRHRARAVTLDVLKAAGIK